jgi:diacylglycerol kinase (ATP)
MKQPLNWKYKIKSFKHAFDGLKVFYLTEQNSWIHTLFALLAIVIGFVIKISITEWLFVIFAIGSVFLAEIFNSAIEHLANAFTQEQNQKIKIVKDLAAGAVLITAFTAIVIAVVIFIPKIISIID